MRVVFTGICFSVFVYIDTVCDTEMIKSIDLLSLACVYIELVLLVKSKHRDLADVALLQGYGDSVSLYVMYISVCIGPVHPACVEVSQPGSVTLWQSASVLQDPTLLQKIALVLTLCSACLE